MITPQKPKSLDPQAADAWTIDCKSKDSQNSANVNLKFLTRTLAAAVLAFAGIHAEAQDLIARQAPVDVHLNSVKHVDIDNTMETADLNNPASNFYSNWDQKNLRGSQGFIPKGTRIDLRGFAMPTTSRKINSKFGRRWGRMHEGIDIKVYVGDTIRAAFDGKVRIRAYNGRGYGYYIVLRHPNGIETLYGHMSRQLVKENQTVRAGQPIGLGGNTGRSSGSHLHFEVRLCSTPIDPALLFDFPNQDVTGNVYVTTKNYGERGSVALASAQRMDAESGQQHDEVASTSAHSTETRLSGSMNAGYDDAVDEEEEAEDVAAVKSKTSTRNARKSRRARASRTRYTTVKSGDTLYGIAKRNGTTVKELCRKNGIKATKALRPGQRLTL